VPTRYSTHNLTGSPAYKLLVLRDRYCDAAVGADEAIAEANRNMAASTGYEIYLVVRQDLVDVRADVEIWDGDPGENRQADAWTGPTVFDLDCPTGELVLGSPTGTYIGGIDPPQGSGRYAVALYHRGREQAEEAWREVAAVMGLPDNDARIAELLDRHAGVEQYLLRVWRKGELPPAEDDEDV